MFSKYTTVFSEHTYKLVDNYFFKAKGNCVSTIIQYLEVKVLKELKHVSTIIQYLEVKVLKELSVCPPSYSTSR